MGRTQITGENVAQDTLTGDDILEEALDANKIPFSDSEFVSLNVHSAIVEAKSSGGLLAKDILTGYNNLEVLVDCSGDVLTGEE